MTLKAVLFDFNGVIIKDEAIHQTLIEELLLAENLSPSAQEYRAVCLGRSDRVCLAELFKRRGRIITQSDLTKLLTRKAQAYQRQLDTLAKLPLYPGFEDLIFRIRGARLAMGVVSGALRSEIESVLQRAQLVQYFSVIVAGDDITTSKPEPAGYLLAVEQLNQQNSSLNVQAAECLAIEDTPAGIEAAKRAGMQVVGVANTYPLHLLQRQANWTVDDLYQLELDRVQQVYAQRKPSPV